MHLIHISFFLIPGQDDKTVRDALSFLKYYENKPWPDVIDNWEKTFEHRRIILFKSKRRRQKNKKEGLVDDYITLFPVLKHKAGYQLVSYNYLFHLVHCHVFLRMQIFMMVVIFQLVTDFNQLYPDKAAALFSKHESFMNAIRSLAVNEVKDKFGKTILQFLDQSQLTESEYHLDLQQQN